MRDTEDTAERADRPRVHGRATEIPVYLSGPLQGYFAVSEQVPLPARLAALLGRIEAGLPTGGTVGGPISDTFRGDLIRALPALRTFAISLCANPTRADDLVQETLTRAWANREKFAPGTNFTAWTFTILRNHFYSEVRKHKREVEDAEGAHASRLTAPAGQEHTVALGSVMNLIGTLPLPQRQALLLVGAEGFTYEEAATQLGCQIGTVKSRVSRARTFLVEHLAPVPVERDAALA